MIDPRVSKLFFLVLIASVIIIYLLFTSDFADRGDDVHCGDGLCTPPKEDSQNCPKDCDEDYCLLQSQGYGEGRYDCCEGLDRLKACESCAEEDCVKDCDCKSLPGACSDCGDGICQNVENLCNCPDDCGEVKESYLELHEWGVLAGCEASDSFELTSRPELAMTVRLPVIYVHSKGIDRFNASFSGLLGGIMTYPKAETVVNDCDCTDCDCKGGTDVVWRDVIIGQNDKGALPAGRAIPKTPLEEMIPTLSDVDADSLSYRNDKSKFLFYEGTVEFKNNIEVSYDLVKKTATFKNKGDYPVENLILARQKGGFVDYEVYVGFLDRLEAGGNETIDDFIDWSYDDILFDDLLSLGFSEKEARAFEEIWSDAVFAPDNSGFSNLFYRIPKSEYDKLLPARIEPEPDKFIRALYVLIDLKY